MLRVDFTFDKKIIEKNGYTMSNIYETIKMEFGKKITQIEYVNKANKLLSSKVGGNIQGFTNKLGYTFRYNKKLN